MVAFRRRFPASVLAEINEAINRGEAKEASTRDSDEDPPSNGGTLILDAICAPADIHFPTDAGVLNDARTRKNLQYCAEHSIALNDPKLGRPPKDWTLFEAQKRLERQEAGERNAIEGEFGEAKRRYRLGRITARLQETSETSIHLIFLVMNLEKILRDLLAPILRELFLTPFPETGVIFG